MLPLLIKVVIIFLSQYANFFPGFIILVVLFALMIKKRRDLGAAFAPAVVWVLLMFIGKCVNLVWFIGTTTRQETDTWRSFAALYGNIYVYMVNGLHLLALVIAGVAILIKRERNDFGTIQPNN
jgi:hypothetical protein